MSTEIRNFPTLDVITVSSGILVSDSGIGCVYELCGFMLSDEALMTHQLPAASRACEPELIRQHPWLGDIDPPRGDKPALKAWCAEIVEQHGADLPVAAFADPPWRSGNALRDLLDIAGDRPVIVVRTDPPDGQQ